jgi:beta-carotene ketolase (CrtW type)
VHHVLLQTFLYTGLFITAHDAMHGTVHSSRRVNMAVGALASWLFAGMWYAKLRRNHFLHHDHPAHNSLDPDYHPSNRLLPWFATFLWRYATVPQILWNGALYNILVHIAGLPEVNVLAYWMAPAFLASFQLFYVGTYLPHRRPHDHTMPHNARSQRRNHIVAFLSCYFFGYHAEHHTFPGAPWWRLWKVKDAAQQHRGT